jgi:hypothetical protein
VVHGNCASKNNFRENSVYVVRASKIQARVDVAFGSTATDNERLKFGM